MPIFITTAGQESVLKAKMTKSKQPIAFKIRNLTIDFITKEMKMMKEAAYPNNCVISMA